MKRTLNIQVPDKLYLALTKASEQKGISLAGLVRMISTEWVHTQPQDIKGILTYPENLLEGLTLEERKEHLDAITTGGYSYNHKGDALHDPEDDDGEDYETLATPEEIKASQDRLK